jgi:hypothetical protein
MNGKTFVFAIDEPNRVVSRVPLPPEGVNDMITMSDLSEASILWNIKVRYDHRQFYVGIKAKKKKQQLTYFFFSKFLDIYWEYSHCCQSILYVS